MDTAQALDRTPGVLTLGGRPFVVLPPTPRDKIATQNRMKELARARCISPLEYALKHTYLPAAALALAVSEAIKLGSGGGVDPTDDAVWEQYTSLAGVRWRVWYHISRVLKEFTLAEVEPIVTEDNVLDAAEALDLALRLVAIDPNAPAPATGSAS